MLKSNQNLKNNLNFFIHVCIPVLEDIIEAEAALDMEIDTGLEISNPRSFRSMLMTGETSNPWHLFFGLMRGAKSSAAFHATDLMLSTSYEGEQPSSMLWISGTYCRKFKLLTDDSPFKNMTAVSNAIALISAVGNAPRWIWFFVPSRFLLLQTRARLILYFVLKFSRFFFGTACVAD